MFEHVHMEKKIAEVDLLGIACFGDVHLESLERTLLELRSELFGRNILL